MVCMKVNKERSFLLTPAIVPKHTIPILKRIILGHNHGLEHSLSELQTRG